MKKVQPVHVVVPTNFEPRDEKAVRFAMEVVYKPGTTIDLVHIVRAREEPQEVYHGEQQLYFQGFVRGDDMLAFRMQSSTCELSAGRSR
jgi:hypothetical protein